MFLYHGENLIDLIGEHLIQYVQIEFISRFQLIQISEQSGTGQSSMGCNHAVGAAAADRQRSSMNMTGRDLKDTFGSAVVNGDGLPDFWNGNIAHNSAALRVQKLIVIAVLQI